MWTVLFSLDKMGHLHSLICFKMRLLASIFICGFVKRAKCMAMLQIYMKRDVEQLVVSTQDIKLN